MLTRMRELLVPAAQRRTLEELTAELDLRSGDRPSNYSAYWTMLVLSAVIAAAGVISDSTATVIGAMIIAPLATPIMGMALGLVKRHRTGAGWFVLGGAAAVVAVGLVASLAVPRSYDLLSNSQISGRTSPGLADLIAAMATGLAGAVALARRNVAAVLPGVAIAISLEPPLVVAGVCLGDGAPGLALGALVLFLSNVLALVLAGTFIFAALGYLGAKAEPTRIRTALVLSAVALVVIVPLGVSTAANYLFAAWRTQVKHAATAWLAATPGAIVTNVQTRSKTFHISVRTPNGLPPVPDLLSRLHGIIPDGSPVVVDTTQGRTINAGTVKP
ncbi:putative hydrophobic protein (TIGR00271 family) [Actinomadura luteofluorescens]|uniref:Putative hydrophobic protein (TIGR00271 family) n=1 Tax=Actinomadura luteofluorescens TaxID=46163 RepID=A0A7Y9EHS5_9ACTN|nr:DUF389 domain-containing protein [Actinomadura luteofluorescens]NYD47912.1 putative hydrophobic protein (TIGR00271 family) [Actinomadura luteofluorescens]